MNKSKILLSLLAISIILIILITIIIILCFINKSKFTEIPEFYNFYYEIDNVLTNEECDYIINDAKDKLSESTVMSIDKNGKYIDVKDTVRTSNHTFLENNLHKNIIEKAEKLINKYSQIPINSKQFEQIQVVRYKPTQEYKEHFDICHPQQAPEDQLKTCQEDFKKFNSVRYTTIIFYLNDGFNGGETYFPNINKKIIPKKGKALIFFNCTYNKDTSKTGLCDIIDNSKHAGLPVVEGKTDEKWIANIWIRTKNL
jgi:prolyl 4-hydroxylase